jgi:G:T-mismatch repair DNA endonuclease (very short patch repair protein)
MTQRLCGQCEQPFTPRKNYSKEQQAKQRFCSGDCARRANALLAKGKKPRIKGKPCERCGRIGYDRVNPICRYCQKELRDPGGERNPKWRITRRVYWNDEKDAVLKEHYSTKGAEYCANQLDISAQAVRCRANRLGLRLTKDATKRIVNAKAKEYMIKHNPMKRDEVKEKVKKFYNEHPETREAVNAALHRGQAELQRRKVSKLELALRVILDGFGVSYEASVEIKPNFIVDIRIGQLIIQADGDYWHGHSRFEPLTERQQKQKQRDAAQDDYLRACGYTVARIWESDMSADSVLHILDIHAIPRAA